MTDYLKESQEVLKKVQSLAKKRELGCVSVSEIAKILFDGIRLNFTKNAYVLEYGNDSKVLVLHQKKA